ncbi:sigma-54-dependent Fis family transcriptional regulator [bacterium]|nr:sigma-54-dependent Fis family transcriptional regulator [bacterium]
MLEALDLLVQGKPDQALERIKGLPLPESSTTYLARLEILRARISKAQGDFELAERSLERARYLLPDGALAGLRGAVEYQLGILYKSASEFQVAARSFEKAITQFQKAGLKEWRHRTIFNRMIALRKVGNLSKAHEDLLQLNQTSLDLLRSNKYLNEFARLYLALEDDHQVRKHLEMIAQATDENTPIRSRVITHEVWADYHKLRGEWPEALAAIDAGLELAYKISEQNDLVGELLRRRAWALYELERSDEAFSAAKRSLEVCERVGEVYEIGALFRTLGLLAERRNEPAEGENLLLKAVEFYRDKDEKYERAFSHMALAGFYERAHESRKREDDLREAFRHMASALGLFDEMGIAPRIAQTRAHLDALTERLPSKPFTPPDGQTLAALGKVHGIISADVSIAKLLEVLDTVAPSDAAVLITGETGTGKELFARALHKLSGRKGDLVIVNCAAIPDELMESELFGHLKGSFTGAHRDRAGKFAQADKGTLFLDEIGDLSPRLQAKLLRVLQDGIYSPVGSDEDCHADVRVVSATNRDLAALVTRGRFRRDLLYRLNHVVLALPALRDRGEDAVLLTRYFIHEIGTRLGRKIALDPHAEDKIREYPWPGNVRELQSLVGRMALFARDTGHLSVDLFPESVLTPVEDFGSDLASIVLKAEKDAILAALTRARGNKAAAARILGVSRSTLNDKIARLNLSAERIARAARA